MESTRFSQPIQNLRTLALIGVILHHSAFGAYKETEYSLIYYCYLNFLNYGSILFMIISGFFFQKSLIKHSINTIIKKKLYTVVLPYLLFGLPWLAFEYFIAPNLGRQKETITFNEVVIRVFLKTNYWFIINLIIVQAINLMIKDLRSWRILLAVFSAITIMHSINIYYRWMESAHSYAFLGFLSFFFAGRLIFKYKNTAKRLFYDLKKSNYIRLFLPILLLVFFSFSIIESQWIHVNKPKDDFTNVLRFSNIALSILLFCIFFQFRNRFRFPGTLSSRSVFLVYLIHPYFLRVGSFISYKSNISFANYGAPNILINIVYGTIILVISLKVAEQILFYKRLRQEQ